MLHFKNYRTGTFGALVLCAGMAHAQAGAAHLTVNVDQPGVKINPMFYGLMTEEINHAYDGGLYGELLRNRAFRSQPTNPVHWRQIPGFPMMGEVSLEHGIQIPGTAITTAIKLTMQATDGQHVAGGISNEGYWGIPAKPNTTYHASFYAKAEAGYKGPLNVLIVGNVGYPTLAEASVAKIGTEWKKYTVTLKTGQIKPSVDNQFIIESNHGGTVWIAHASLFGPTYKNRPNGLRPDLMEKMAEMRPKFLRLPGGNYLEGNKISERFDWKKTVGDIAERPGHPCPWGYPSTDGLGLLEYLEWCEDLKMEPLLAVFAGYALGGEVIPAGDRLQPFVQDALDEIEYVTGDVHTKWGAVRAKNGHPKPFPLHYVEIGNEDGFDRSGSYPGRFVQFSTAIKAKYPNLQTIATLGGEWYGKPKTESKLGEFPDLIDDHYYQSAKELAKTGGRYDTYSRTGPKIFVGEWATTVGSPTPTLGAAIGDAAFLTGLERNADVVLMESYAPLLVNVNPGARQWGTNLIGYNALESFVSPSHSVQSIFAANTGDVTLKYELAQADPSTSEYRPHGGVGVGTYSTEAEFKDLQVFHDGQVIYSKKFSTGLADVTLDGGQWKAEGDLLKQTSDARPALAFLGDPSWTDYTLKVKARKTGGREGFFVLFDALGVNNHWRWNIGGWGNTRSAIEHAMDGDTGEFSVGSSDKVETGRWYDVKVEVAGKHVRCFLDEKLVNEFDTAPTAPSPDFYVAPSLVKATGEVILKVVNMSSRPMALDLKLAGGKTFEKSASGWVLTGNPEDMNSLETPNKVAPKALDVSWAGETFSQEYAAHSVTVLRFKPKK